MSSTVSASIAAFFGGLALDKIYQRPPTYNCWCECAPYLSRSAVLAGVLVGILLGAGAAHLYHKLGQPSAPSAAQALTALSGRASAGTQTGGNLAQLRR